MVNVLAFYSDRPSSIPLKSTYLEHKQQDALGGSPGLVVMGGDSCTEGRGFDSHLHVLDGYISHILVAKNVMFVWKEAGCGPCLNSKTARLVEIFQNEFKKFRRRV